MVRSPWLAIVLTRAWKMDGVPQVVHAICPACGAPTSGAEVLPDEGVLACDLCGVRSSFEMRPPLLFLTGASGAGKTTLYQSLVGHVREAVLIDQDLLWSVDPAHNSPETNYRQFRGLLLHLADRLARNRMPVLIEGSCVPEQYEALGERWFFAKTAYLAVTCDDDELERRLKARPSWRKADDHLDTMLAFNRWIRTHAGTTTPPMDVLDTTNRSVADCAREVHSWIRRQVSDDGAA